MLLSLCQYPITLRTLVNKMASKCHEFTNKIIRGYLQLTNSACKWELIYSYSELWYFSWISFELYKPQCNSKICGRKLKVYQCKTYKNMDYYHLQVRMKVDKKVSLLWKRSDELRCTADSNESQKGCRSVIWPENLGSVSLGSRWLSLLPRLKFDELLGCEVWSGLLIGIYRIDGQTDERVKKREQMTEFLGWVNYTEIHLGRTY